MTRLIFVVFTLSIKTDLFFKFKVFLEDTCLSGAKNLQKFGCNGQQNQHMKLGSF